MLNSVVGDDVDRASKNIEFQSTIEDVAMDDQDDQDDQDGQDGQDGQDNQGDAETSVSAEPRASIEAAAAVDIESSSLSNPASGMLDSGTVNPSKMPSQVDAELSAIATPEEQRLRRQEERRRRASAAARGKEEERNAIARAVEKRKQQLAALQAAKITEMLSTREARLAIKSARMEAAATALATRSAAARSRASSVWQRQASRKEEQLQTCVTKAAQDDEAQRRLVADCRARYAAGKDKWAALEAARLSEMNQLRNEAIANVVQQRRSKQRHESYSSIWDAIQAGVEDEDTLRNLFPVGLRVCEIRDADGRTTLHEACWKGNVEQARALLRIIRNAGESVTSFSQVEDSSVRRITALHEAARAGWSSEMVDLLVGSGANVEARDHHGDTPLHCAARHGHARTCLALIKAGGGQHPLTLRNGKKRTARDLVRQATIRSAEAGEVFPFCSSKRPARIIFDAYDKEKSGRGPLNVQRLGRSKKSPVAHSPATKHHTSEAGRKYIERLVEAVQPVPVLAGGHRRPGRSKNLRSSSVSLQQQRSFTAAMHVSLRGVFGEPHGGPRHAGSQLKPVVRSNDT